MRRLRIAVPVSLALHALVALGVSRLAWQTPRPSTQPLSRVAWLIAATPAPIIPAESAGASASRLPRSPPDEPTIEREPQRPARLNDRGTRPEPSETASTRSPEPSRRPLIDLADARERAVDAVLEEHERGSSYRSFTFPGTLGDERAFDESERQRRAEAGLQAPLTAFDSPSKGRAGLDQKTALGVYTKWVSDDCYQTYGTGNPFILPSAQRLYSIPTTTCVDAQARADLFEHAKPRYLMDDDERVAVAERLERIERLRRPTTGSVMSLAK
jgi:hypothetical protein